MRRAPFLKPSSLFADSLIVVFIASTIYGVVLFAAQWEASYQPTYRIDLALSSIPTYAFFSALRGLVAYGVSLVFSLVVGYWAAKSSRAERVVIPFLDVMQSVPVLGFLPGLVLALVAIFPRTNVGLELASILMIFTSQVWNMTFAFYSSVKSVPFELQEAASIMKLSRYQRLRLLELPFSAMSLAWNSVMAMAGGWFFLMVCEAFTLGDRQYRLPGLGAYMAVAVEAGDRRAILGGVVGMIGLIMAFDILLWRPALVWARRFRLEETEEQRKEETLLALLIRDSAVVRGAKGLRSRWFVRLLARWRERTFRWRWPEWARSIGAGLVAFGSSRGCRAVVWIFVGGFLLYGGVRLLAILALLPAGEWPGLLSRAFATLARVLGAVFISTLWATPAGIWIARNPRRLRGLMPLVQLAASFPAPMLYPFAIAFFLRLSVNSEIASMLLMMLGVQWYVLFNVIAGAMRIPVELELGMRLIGSGWRDRWRYLILPSVLPSLVTGWVTAAGGAWNASIVAEVIESNARVFRVRGLGAEIAAAAARGDFPRLAACLSVMVILVISFNRLVWERVYRIAQTRFRIDL